VPSGDEIFFLFVKLNLVKCSSYSAVKKWVAGLRIGRFSTEDQEHFVRPYQVTVPENMVAIHSVILDIQRILTERIVKSLAISQERVGFIDMRKFSAKWVPKCLNADQKRE
jgi:hypothetical protein